MTTLVPGSMINQTTLFTSSSLYSGNINAGNIAAGNVSVTGTLPPPVGIYANAANSLALATNSAARLILDANGNVGVGTAAPVQALHVQGNAYLTGTVGIGTAAGTTLDVYGQTRIKQTSESAAITSAANFYIQRFADDSRMTLAYATAPDAWVINTSYGSTGSYKPLVLATSDTERMRITSSGFVGINTNNPSYQLDVNGYVMAIGPTASSPGSGGQLRYRDDSGTLRYTLGLLGTVGNTAYSIYDNVNGAERMRISDAGYVTKPYQPAWYAAFNGFTCTNAGTAYTPTSYYQVNINVSNSFISSTGIFTAPVAGTYIMFASFLRSSSANVFRGNFQKNGADCDLGELRTTEGYTGYNQPTAHVAIVSADVNDQLKFTISCGTAGGSIYASTYNYFGGYLLG